MISLQSTHASDHRHGAEEGRAKGVQVHIPWHRGKAKGGRHAEADVVDFGGTRFGRRDLTRSRWGRYICRQDRLCLCPVADRHLQLPRFSFGYAVPFVWYLSVSIHSSLAVPTRWYTIALLEFFTKLHTMPCHAMPFLPFSLSPRSLCPGVSRLPGRQSSTYLLINNTRLIMLFPKQLPVSQSSERPR